MTIHSPMPCPSTPSTQAVLLSLSKRLSGPYLKRLTCSSHCSTELTQYLSMPAAVVRLAQFSSFLTRCGDSPAINRSPKAVCSTVHAPKVFATKNNRASQNIAADGETPDIALARPLLSR